MYIQKIKTGMIMFLSALFLLMLFFAVKGFEAQASAIHASIDINYSFDYSDYSDDGGVPTGTACTWESDTYESEGLCLQVGSGDEPHCLSTWDPEMSEGYVIYNLKSESNKFISELKMYITGRIFHYAHVGCRECRLEVYAARNYVDLSEPIDVIYANEVGATMMRKWNLTEYIKDAQDCFVKVKIVGAGQTWVNLEHIAFEGSEYYLGYKDETVSVVDKTSDNLYFLPQNGSVDIEPKQVLVSTLSTDYSIDIKYGKIGSPETCDAGSLFSIADTGNYRMYYTVNIYDRIYNMSSDFYVVEDRYDNGFVVKADDEWNLEKLGAVNNYTCEQDTVIEKVGENIKIAGQASYLLPLNFEKRFNFLFTVPSFESSGYFLFAVTGQCGKLNFNVMDVSGLYFLCKKNSNGNILINGYFSDGENVSYLGQTVLSDLNVHGIGFCRRSDVPKTGLDIYFDGYLFSPYECCYTVNTDLFMPNNKVYMAFKSFDCDFRVMRIVESDYRSPVLKNSDGSAVATSFDAEVGEFFQIPDFIMEDDVDGIVPFTMKITDPYGNIVIPENGKIFVNYEGRYTFLCFATDYSGNSADVRFRLNAELKDGAPQMLFYDMVSENGRKGLPFDLPCPEVYVNGEYMETPCVQVDITSPSGNKFSHNYNAGETLWTFIPEEIGIYGFNYSVINDIAETNAYYETNIKLDVDYNESYENIKKSDNWQSGLTATKETEKGIKIFDSSYNALPIEMSEGLEITLDLTSLGNKAVYAQDYIDCWVALAVGAMPKTTRFGLYEEGFIYFMFYRENSEYFVNVVARSNGVDYGILSGFSLESTGIAILSINKKKNSESVNLYINHRIIDNAALSGISFDKLTDDENFSYLSVSVFGESSIAPENFKAITILNLSVCDQEAPTVSFVGTWITSAALGEKIILPNISVSDNSGEGHYRSEISFFAPDGTQIEYAPGEFVADKEGVYYFVIKAIDNSGNKLLSVYELSVGEKGHKANNGNVMVIMIVIVGIGITGASAALVVLFCIKKRKRKC